MTTDKKRRTIDAINEELRAFGLCVGEDSEPGLVVLVLDANGKESRVWAARDDASANPLDGEAVERVARAMYEQHVAEYRESKAHEDGDPLPGYWLAGWLDEYPRTVAMWKRRASAALSAMPKDACSRCDGAGEWRDGQTSGRCQACHGSGRVPKDGRAPPFTCGRLDAPEHSDQPPSAERR